MRAYKKHGGVERCSLNNQAKCMAVSQLLEAIYNWLGSFDGYVRDERGAVGIDQDNGR